MTIEWKKCYLDVILVPLGFMICTGYHLCLWHKVRIQPLTTIMGTNACALRFWVSAMMKDNEKKNILAIQTLRNMIMGSTLMATTSILLSSGLAVVVSSTYSIKKPLNAVYGAHGEFMVALKYVSLLFVFLFSFVCHTLSIRFTNQVNFLINLPLGSSNGVLTLVYVSQLLERGVLLNTVGNRLFYAALPLVMWIFGPVLVFLCFLGLVVMLYNLDFVPNRDSEKENLEDQNGEIYGCTAA